MSHSKGDLTEVLALAICGANSPLDPDRCPCLRDGNSPSKSRGSRCQDAVREAASALTALDAAGFQIVPKEPTEPSGYESLPYCNQIVAAPKP